MPPLFTRSFVALLVAQTCFGYALSSFFLLPKFLTRDLGASPREVGLVMAAFGAASIVFIPLVGAAVDRLGRRRFMTAGALVMAAGSMGFLGIDRVGPAIYALRVVQGLAFALSFTAAATLVADEAPPDRMGHALGLFGASMLGMNALAPAIAEELADRFGWSSVFAVAAALALASAVLTARVRERRHAPATGAEATLREVALRARSLRISLVVALAGAAFGAMMTFSQPFALALGDTHVRGFFVAYAAAAVSLRLGLGGLADRLGRGRVSVASLAIYALALVAMAHLARGKLAWVGALFGVAHGLFYPAFNALAVEGVGPRERGKVMALFNGAWNAGNAGATFGLGFVAEAMGFPAVFWISAAGVTAALALLAASPEARPGVSARRAGSAGTGA